MMEKNLKKQTNNPKKLKHKEKITKTTPTNTDIWFTKKIFTQSYRTIRTGSRIKDLHALSGWKMNCAYYTAPPDEQKEHLAVLIWELGLTCSTYEKQTNSTITENENRSNRFKKNYCR